jgi:septum site-determining protein MinD
MHARIIGIISVKGGVGKTTAVANLGVILNKFYDKKVLIVDGNFSGPNLGLHFGFSEPDYTVHEVLEGKVSVQKAVYSHESGIDILPGSIFSRKVDVNKFRQYVVSLRSFYDVILIDASPSLNDEVLATILAADELFVITTPDHVTLNATLHALRVAKERRTYVAGLILNKLHGKKFALSMKEIEDATKTPVVAVLKDDDNFLESLAHTTPLAITKPKNDAIVEYKKLAAALVGQKYKDNTIKGLVSSMFSKGYRQDEINRAVLMESHY